MYFVVHYDADRKTFRSDNLASVDSTCSIASEVTTIHVNDECDVNILQLCNGLMHCADCADETYETCLSAECTGSTSVYMYMYDAM